VDIILPDLLLYFFLVLIVVAVVVGLAARRRRRTPGPSQQQQPPSEAITELDLRYARGEIERDEYLQRRADLLGQPAPPQSRPTNGPGHDG
jgi:putative membrane protein